MRLRSSWVPTIGSTRSPSASHASSFSAKLEAVSSLQDIASRAPQSYEERERSPTDASNPQMNLAKWRDYQVRASEAAAETRLNRLPFWLRPRPPAHPQTSRFWL